MLGMCYVKYCCMHVWDTCVKCVRYNYVVWMCVRCVDVYYVYVCVRYVCMLGIIMYICMC